MENEELDLTEQEAIRRAKLDKYIEKGIDPFGHKYDVTDWSEDLKQAYSNFTHEELEEKSVEVSVAGRIMTLRDMGKVAFMHIQDRKGKIQIYLRKDVIGEEAWEVFKLADIGDIIGVKGKLMMTKTGELSIRANEYTHLTKALRPLPEKFHGLQDKEEARRRRYVDLIMNEDSKKIAFTRPKIIRGIQRYLDSKGFVEVETPVLDPILGGASARPFVTHHNALDMDFYLRIATELHLKRLIVGGMERVYEIGRLFRNEGMDATHNPEFTSIEAYQAYGDLSDMMDLAEGLFKTLALEIRGSDVFDYQGNTLDFSKPFKRLKMVDGIREVTGVDFTKVTTVEEAIKLANEHNIELQEHQKSIGHIVNLFFETYVEETLIQPTFLYEYPLEVSPLTKKNPNNPNYTDRFELFINGKEYGNAYTELNDPIDQKERFINQLKEKDLGNDEANEMDIDFIESLEYGMAPTGGIGIGVDRLVMLLTNTDTIRDVLLFPHMKVNK
jgi:lysyl-tRNA synthetase class 2